MLRRREFLLSLAGAALVPRRVWLARGSQSLYASVGRVLMRYDVDVVGATLVARESVELPAGVQYAWPHASKRFLYVASSDGGPAAIGAKHFLSAFRVDSATGALTPHGDDIALRTRPINVTTDIPSDFLLTAYNSPSGITVHRINGDGTIGVEVQQPERIDGGLYAHQVRIAPSNRFAILVTRGNDATPLAPEEPGAFKVFRYGNGLLTGEVSVAPNLGYGFGPRHIDFHPSAPWMFVSMERENQIRAWRLAGEGIAPDSSQSRDMLADPARVVTRQLAGTVHVHPSGRFVYGANRADGTVDVGGKAVFNDGENSLVVYSFDAPSGQLTLVQRMDTRGIHARTFHIDPTGRLLVAGNVAPLALRSGVVVPASLAVFRIGRDGRLTFARKYDVDVGGGSLFWVGMV